MAHQGGGGDGGDGRDDTGLGRRSLLGALGVAAVGSVATAGAGAPAGARPPDTDDAGVVSVVQGDECVPVVPLVGHEPVEALYDYRVPDQFTGDNGATDPGEGPYFQSNGTADLQREDVTVSFLYLGPRGLSLVVVHDSGAEGSDGTGGSVTWTVEDVPRDAEWAVKDDLYLDPETGEQADSNYDAWAVDGRTHTVDWTWGSAGTDGGALRTAAPPLELTVHPAFNEAAALWGEHYATDPIREWQLLSFPDGRASPERTALALDEPVTVGAGPCEGGPASPGDDTDDGEADGERDGTVTVEIYLKIGSFSLHRRGAIPVGIGLDGALEASDVVAESLRFGPPDVVEDGGGARPVRGGHDDDPVFHFPATEAGFEFGDTSAKLVGRTEDGRTIEGTTGVSLDGVGGTDAGAGDDRRPGENDADGDSTGDSALDDLLDGLL